MVEAVNDSAMSRQQVREQLIELAKDQLFTQFDTYEVLRKDEEIGYESRRGNIEGKGNITITKFRTKRATLEQLTPMLKDPTSVQQACNDRLSMERLEDVDGVPTYHMIAKAPSMLVSDRSTINSYYFDVDLGDGSHTMINSSLGNEALEVAYKKQIKKNVVAKSHIGMFSVKELGDGEMEIRQMVCLDPAGMIPDFIKNKIAKRLKDQTEFVVRYLVTGEKPPPL